MFYYQVLNNNLLHQISSRFYLINISIINMLVKHLVYSILHTIVILGIYLSKIFDILNKGGYKNSEYVDQVLAIFQYHLILILCLFILFES